MSLALQNQIILGDCLEKMKDIPDNSIDLIITSPPYNLGNGHHTGNHRHKEYDDDIPESEYQKWQLNVLNECFRILKSNGSMMYNHKNRIKNGVQITPYEWILKSNFIVKQEIIWFTRSQNFDKIRFYPMTERIYWLAKTPETKLFNAINHHDLFTKEEWKTVGSKGVFKRAFPEKLSDDLIQCFPDSKIILDPFAGSGTVAISCLKADKNYVCIENDKEHFEIMKNRITEHKSKLLLQENETQSFSSGEMK
jgi:modification methylase